MKILLTNDDGIHAEGIAALHKELKKFGKVTVIAPDSERSSISHAITLGQPVYLKKFKLGHGLSGTPSDCVKFGVDQIFGAKPDIVVSGINLGPNEGCSVIYSGTVAGAREGALLNIPSFAISLATFTNPTFDDAAKIAVKVIKAILKKGVPAKTFFNINVPNVPKSKIKGIRFTKQCMVPIHGTFTKRLDPNKKPYYWLSGKIPIKNKSLSVDSYALSQDYVTITPIHCDATDYEALEELHEINIAPMINEDEIKHARILIIDDDIISLKLLEELFIRGGFLNTTITADSREARDLYLKLEPDLIILDLNMPHKDGFQVLDELVEANPEDYLPVVVLTEAVEQGIRFRALQSGAKDFLNKPYDRIEVLLRFRNLIGVHMLHRQIRDQNALLEQSVKERTRELYETQLDVITRLARAIEYRDSETGLHIVRMSRYSSLLASQIGLSMDYCDIVLQASPLHDIGKIGIPDKILQKPGSLTDEEWEIMKTHTTIGAELLSGSNSKFLNVAREIALTHHERWDGSGYPQGLKGEEIPIVGRICGLTDVFDALMSARPYKDAWTIDNTVEEIKKGRKTHFDPKVLDAFVNVLPEIKKIYKRYIDPYKNDA